MMSDMSARRDAMPDAICDRAICDRAICDRASMSKVVSEHRNARCCRLRSSEDSVNSKKMIRSTSSDPVSPRGRDQERRSQVREVVCDAGELRTARQTGSNHGERKGALAVAVKCSAIPAEGSADPNIVLLRH